jgi:hypothetical protein
MWIKLKSLQTHRMLIIELGFWLFLLPTQATGYMLFQSPVVAFALTTNLFVWQSASVWV